MKSIFSTVTKKIQATFIVAKTLNGLIKFSISTSIKTLT